MTQGNSVIVKSNHIVEASYRLSVAEQRVILSAISQVRRDQSVTDEMLYSVTAIEIAKLCGTDPKTAYRDLQSAAERLQTRRVTLILEPDGVTIRSKRRRVTCWVQSIDYVDQEGRIELRFGKDILPYLTGLQREFTRYALSDVAKMTSAYGIRLYELLAQWSGGYREIALDDLRRWLQLEDRYPLMADLRRWVIEPAVSQINEHSPISVSWVQRKTGRKVTHIQFTFGPKETTYSGLDADSAKPKKRSVITKAEAEKLARAGETYDELYQRLNSEYIIRG